jgi:hypothetical protein
MSDIYKNKKIRAIKLRKRGFTYSDILKEVDVAKSTLSLWLRDCNLTKRQQHKITERKLSAIKKGGEAKRKIRINKEQEIYKKSEKDLKNILSDPVWLSGIMLYWAEGSKIREHNPSVGLEFINSDPKMIQFFILWCRKVFNLSDDRFVFSVYIHDNARNNKKKVIEYWSRQTGFRRDFFKYIYFKKHKPLTKRKNIEENYYGTLKVRISKSTDLNRVVKGWVRVVCDKYCRIV